MLLAYVYCRTVSTVTDLYLSLVVLVIFPQSIGWISGGSRSGHYSVMFLISVLIKNIRTFAHKDENLAFYSIAVGEKVLG